MLFESNTVIILWQYKNAGIAQSVEQLIRNQQVVCSSHITSSRKNSCSKEQEFFQLYSPSASYIELRSVIFASQVIFALRVLKANIISLKPQVSISLSRSENITLCEAQNITKTLPLCRFYAIIHLKDGDEMELLEYLKCNISTNISLDEIINTFEEMCKTPIEEDLLLNEYGVYDFTGEDLFYYDLVRQYPDGEDEYFQLRVSIMFSPDEKNRFLQDTLWSDDSDENFFDYIKKSDGYAYAKAHEFKSIDIRIDQT